MDNRVEDENYLVFVKHNLAELEERIRALGERIGVMKAGKYETSAQSLLLSTMLEVRKDLNAFIKELLEDFNVNYSHPQPHLRCLGHRG